MKKIDRRIVIIAALIFILGLSYGLMRYLISIRDDTVSLPVVDAKRLVKCDTIDYHDVISTVEAPGRLISSSETDIVSEAAGKIIAGKVPLRKGGKFKKGDLLFSIYPDEVRLALYSRKSQFKSSLANLLPDLRFDFPEQEQELRDYFNALSIEKDFPPFPVFKDEKLSIFLSGRFIISEYYNIKKDELQLKRHNVYAPYDGTFIEVYLEEGAYTNTGGKVASCISTDRLEVEVALERFHSEWVKIGDAVDISSEISQLSYKGKVVRKSAYVDQYTQSQLIFVSIEKASEKNFLKGEYVHVVFPGHPIPNAMEIPRNAVFNNDQVFVVVDGRLQKRTINIIKINTTSLIFNGIPEGEIVVVQPLVHVLEGTVVEVFDPSADYSKSNSKEGKKLKGGKAN
jgi:multidrug efflux pump subunit AcrA (membrane-fusion protein)